MHPRRSLARAALVPVCCALAIFWAAPVGACLPVPPPRPGVTPPTPIPTMTASEAAAQATVIFRGHPIRRDDISYTITDTNATRTTFAVETLWKGPSQPTFTIVTLSCGAPDTAFAANGTYIIYARGDAAKDLSALDQSRRATATEPEDTLFGPGTRPASPAVQPTAQGTAPIVAVTPSIAPTVIATATPSAAATTAPVAQQPMPLAGRDGWLLPLAIGGVVGAAGTLLASTLRRKGTR